MTSYIAVGCLDTGVGMVNELYEFLIQKPLPQHFPTTFCLDCSTEDVENLALEEKLPLLAPADRYETLKTLNCNVDEDLLMLLPSTYGDVYSLQPFVWGYPVGFDPQSKLGMKVRDAHQYVPSYKEKLALSMNRYFSNLEPGNVKNRVNLDPGYQRQLVRTGGVPLVP